MANSLMELYGGGMTGPSNNYQLGGSVSKYALGGQIASSRRNREYQGEIRRLNEAAERMAKRQKRASGLGNILSTVGGIAGSFIPIPGVGTAIGSAIGTAAGSALGRFAGESTYKDTDVGGGKYAQQSRKDLQGYSDDFKESRGERAVVGGLKSGLMKFASTGGQDYLKSKFSPGSTPGGELLQDIPELEQVLMNESPADMARLSLGPTAAQDNMMARFGLDPAAAQETLEGQLLSADSSAYAPFADMPLSDISATQLGDFSNIGLPPQSPSNAYYGPYLPNRRGSGLIPMMPMGGYVNPQRPNAPTMPQPYQPMAGTGPQGQTAGEGASPTTGGTNPYGVNMGAIQQLGQSGWQMFGSDNPVFSSGGDWSGLFGETLGPTGQAETTPGYGTATGVTGALEQMGMGDVATDPRLQKYLKDLPQFSQGYSQQIGDIYAGAGKQAGGVRGRARQAAGKTGFSGSGAVQASSQQAMGQLGTQTDIGRRGVVEGFQSDLLSGIRDIEEKADIEFGVGFEGSPLAWQQMVLDSPDTNTNPTAPPDSAGIQPGQTSVKDGHNWYWNGYSWEDRGPVSG